MTVPPAPPTILVVDDKRNMLRLMTKVLRDVAEVRTSIDGAGAVTLLEDEPIDVVLCDLRMPDMSGLEVLAACRRLQPRAEFILMTAHATVDTAVSALKQGAYDYVTKPFEPEAVKAVVARALHSRKPRPGVSSGDELVPGVHARSRIMRELAETVRHIAESEAPLLLHGEPGTGKRTIASAVHSLSARRHGSHATLDCAAHSEEALGSELAGLLAVVRGGRFGPSAARDAQGGTLVLDHVEALTERLQASLASILEALSSEGGPRHETDADAPPRLVLIATSAHSDEPIAHGRTPADTLRLQATSIGVPPLRARRDDIPVLAAHLLKEETAQDGRPEREFTAGAMERLVAHAWPGNIRELRSVVRRAATESAHAQIRLDDLPEPIRTGPDEDFRSLISLTWSEALSRGRDAAARRYLVSLLEHFDGDVNQAAAKAEVERESFYRLLRRHGIQPDGFRRKL